MSGNHKLININTHATGAQEWLCPACGRRFMVQWTPEYQCVVLNPGDTTAMHNTGHGALVVNTQPVNDIHLKPWESWLDGLDFENLLD